MPSQNNTVKQKVKAITSKPFPGKLVKGVSMLKKLEYAKKVSSRIKGVRRHDVAE